MSSISDFRSFLASKSRDSPLWVDHSDFNSMDFGTICHIMETFQKDEFVEWILPGVGRIRGVSRGMTERLLLSGSVRVKMTEKG
jgi:hypothetical protein